MRTGPGIKDADVVQELYRTLRMNASRQVLNQSDKRYIDGVKLVASCLEIAREAERLASSRLHTLMNANGVTLTPEESLKLFHTLKDGDGMFDTTPDEARVLDGIKQELVQRNLWQDAE